MLATGLHAASQRTFDIVNADSQIRRRDNQMIDRTDWHVLEILKAADFERLFQ
jgi:hypothetical protein